MALSDEVIRQRLQLLESYVQHLQGYRARTHDEVRSDMSFHLQNHLDDFGQFAHHVLQFLAQDG